jgi:hypothetical protein
VISGILPEHEVNAAKAKAIYQENIAKESPQDLLADWHFAVRKARRSVASALRESAFLVDVPAALEKNCAHSLVFRHLMAPPVSQDQFKLRCPQWSKTAESKSKPAKATAAHAAGQVILERLDWGLARWVRLDAPPSREDLRTILKVTAALIAQQQVATARRTRLAFEQEYAVTHLLSDNGWTKLPSKLIDKRAAVPPKHFMHKTRFSTKTRPQEVDIACGLNGTYVLAMECKVTNDETNSVKRINDVLKKAAAWQSHWGSFVVAAALLEGVVAPKDVQRLTDSNVEVFWSHLLDEFLAWLTRRVSS